MVGLDEKNSISVSTFPPSHSPSSARSRQPEKPPLSPIPSNDSTDTLAPADDSADDSADAHEPELLNPCSAFYSHPASQLDLQQQPSWTASRTHLAHPAAAQLPDGDLEAGSYAPPSVDTRAHENSVWPTKATLREKARLAKKASRKHRGGGCLCCRGRQGTARCCGLLSRLDRRQMLYVKVLVVLLVLGITVGVGVGVSRAVGGGVWSGSNTSKQIPSS